MSSQYSNLKVGAALLPPKTLKKKKTYGDDIQN